MTIPLPQLKQVKNAVIGNPSKKSEIARDEGFVRTLVQCLNPPPSTDSQGSSQNDTRTEAAHVLASLAYGSDDSLSGLLHAQTHQALLFALSRLQPTDPPALASALVRALRALLSSAADVVGPPLWGIRVPKRSGRGKPSEEDQARIRMQAGDAVEAIFRIDALDTVLPLLLPSSPSLLRTHLFQLLASVTRTSEHRTALTSWSPPAERAKEVRARRGWEVAPHGPGWLVKELVRLLREQGKDGGVGVLEGALSLLGAVCKDEVGVVGVLLKPEREGHAPMESLIQLAKNRNPDVQLTASLSLAHAVRASLTTPPTTAPFQVLEDACIRTVINVIGGMIKDASLSDERRKKACFVLYYLATDHPLICRTIFDQGCLESLTILAISITPQDQGGEDMWEDESQSATELREAALTTIAILTLFDNEPRNFLTNPQHSILPTLTVSLSHPHPGVRYAACQCVRAISRAVAALRTSAIDSGLGVLVWDVVRRESGEEGDRRVLGAALTVICNVVNNFSPLQDTLLAQDLITRLVQIFHRTPESSIRVSCLWAIKNLVRQSTTELKREVMQGVGWGVVSSLLSDSDTAIQEQAFTVLHNLASNEEGIDLVFDEIGEDVVLDRITAVLSGTDEDVILQATSLLANLANGSHAQRHSIITHPRLLSALRSSIADAKPESRKPAVACIRALAQYSGREGRRMLLDAGLGSTLRHLCEWSNVGVSAGSPTASSPLRTGMGRRNSSVARSVSGGAPAMTRSVSGGGVAVSGVHNWRLGGVMAGTSHGHGIGVAHHHHHHHATIEDDRDVVTTARQALEWLEHGGLYP